MTASLGDTSMRSAECAVTTKNGYGEPASADPPPVRRRVATCLSPERERVGAEAGVDEARDGHHDGHDGRSPERCALAVPSDLRVRLTSRVRKSVFVVALS